MPDSDNVVAIFRELLGDRADRLDGGYFPADVKSRIAEALAEGKADGDEKAKGDSLGFHLVDWQRDAAFIVALTLFPERFTNEEIREEIDSFLWHVPAHVLEAARIGGYPINNIFKDENGSAST